MSRFIRELFQGDSYRHHPRYYYDDAVISYGNGRSSMLHVSLIIENWTYQSLLFARFCAACADGIIEDVERVKQALAIEGVHEVRCDMATQSVVVFGNVASQSLLRRVKWIKRYSSIMSYGSPYAGPAYGSSEIPVYTNLYAVSTKMYNTRPPILEYGSSEYGSPYERPYSSYSYY